MTIDFREWSALQESIARCSECVNRWPDKIVRPLALGEVPGPPAVVQILFVGVAPTAVKGRYKGGHFYSSPSDLLRVGLFRLLEEKFHVSLNAIRLDDANDSFHSLGCFFVHCAKVRPIRDDSPPLEAIQFCAARHLRAEISVLNPRAICFLGKNNAGPVARQFFGIKVDTTPVSVHLDNWSGLAVVAPQPRRGWEKDTKLIVERLWHRI